MLVLIIVEMCKQGPAAPVTKGVAKVAEAERSTDNQRRAYKVKEVLAALTRLPVAAREEGRRFRFTRRTLPRGPCSMEQQREKRKERRNEALNEAAA